MHQSVSEEMPWHHELDNAALLEAPRFELVAQFRLYPILQRVFHISHPEQAGSAQHNRPQGPRLATDVDHLVCGMQVAHFYEYQPAKKQARGWLVFRPNYPSEQPIPAVALASGTKFNSGSKQDAAHLSTNLSHRSQPKMVRRSVGGLLLVLSPA